MWQTRLGPLKKTKKTSSPECSPGCTKLIGERLIDCYCYLQPGGVVGAHLVGQLATNQRSEVRIPVRAKSIFHCSSVSTQH
ncbi:hypothetical protein PoB_000946500 [Plakobranchus ocellatus]|uniref:Uncharacterized protein n=1 Tax=Plakobranchus ocellatus TaxID=259542 RepID=A0AAV3YKF0_9GAST|nr:hypothetical protein PoB_000946500 [Plakobranchus ocellatus]